MMQVRSIDPQKATSTVHMVLKGIDHPGGEEVRAILSFDRVELNFGDIR